MELMAFWLEQFKEKSSSFTCPGIAISQTNFGEDKKVLFEVRCPQFLSKFVKSIKERNKIWSLITGGHYHRFEYIVTVFQTCYSIIYLIERVYVLDKIQFTSLQAGVGQLGTDECDFNSVLCLSSYPQLKAVFRKYKEKREGRTIEEDIESEMSSNLKEGFLSIGKTFY